MQVINKVIDLKLNMLNTSDKLKLIAIVGSSVIIGGFSYLTIKIYINHRKYKHIPGPPNEGYFSFD